MVEREESDQQTKMGIEAIRQSLVHISPEWNQNVMCLGIICGELVFTCAHLAGDRPRVSDFTDTPLYNVKRLHDGAEGRFAEYVATSTDFMVLAPDGVGVGLSEDDGPTQSCFNVLQDEDLEFNDLCPSRVEHHGDQESPAKVKGFFFSPDGKDIQETEFELWHQHPLISFYSDDAQPGCSGGPLFTEDHHLIGVYADATRHPRRNGQKHCLGRRIDLCSPMFVHQRIQWRTLQVHGEQRDANDH